MPLPGAAHVMPISGASAAQARSQRPARPDRQFAGRVAQGATQLAPTNSVAKLYLTPLLSRPCVLLACMGMSVTSRATRVPFDAPWRMT